MTTALDLRLSEHLGHWLGMWPPGSALEVVGSPRRTEPGWDGKIHPALGVGSPSGAVLSVAPEYAGLVDSLGPHVPGLVGHGERGWFNAVFRWTTRPEPLPDAGAWVPADAADTPGWLRPFGGEVLVATDPETGAYLAGVGVKRHDDYGRELAVVTTPEARGRGLARRLVAQAARRVLDEGAVPTYLHADGNLASAAVAVASGFPDRGWRAFGVTEAAR